MINECPSCFSTNIEVFYQIRDMPLNSMLLLPSRAEATNFPTGDVTLGFCKSCGFIFNLEFDPKLIEYSARYEATQDYSPYFHAYLHHLAEEMVERYDLNHKRILEIGCGQGEFLTEICTIGDNEGIGFDPVYRGNPIGKVNNSQIKFISDYYSEKYSQILSDFVCCRMTLEHIQDTCRFINMVRNAIDNESDPIVFFQVPDAGRILRELAFWDIYYEHCSYFSSGSLARLFRKCGFDVLDIEKEYNDQYLLITAKKHHPGGEQYRPNLKEDLLILKRDMDNFRKNYPRKIDDWRQKVNLWLNGKRTVIWGASSKGVSFLSTLNIRDEIEYVVDINPLKRGTFVAKTGQEIISPEQLGRIQPDIVIVMNPIYIPEIHTILHEMNLSPEIVSP